jgi:serine/threonine-protein kinase
VSSPAAPGRVLDGRYRLDALLARGGMASVWIGEDSLLARRVAVKTLHPELAVDDSLRRRFRNEAVAVASLAHPDIVATYDTGEDDGVAYLVMELVDGPNLRALLDDRGQLPVDRAVRIARGVAAALDHAHRNGIVHRDIKPANVLVPDQGPVKVTDFGIAKAEGAVDLTRSGTVVGTARYLAPEQVEARPVDARTDVYALGLLLYEMLAGRSPFQGDSDMAAALARLTTPPPPLRQLRTDVPPAVEAATMRCLAVDPADRFPSANALSLVLDDLTEDSGEIERPTTTAATRTAVAPARPPAPPRQAPPRGGSRPPRTSAPRRRRSAGPWVVLGVLLLGGGAVAGFLATREAGGGGDSNGSTLGVPAQLSGVSDFDPEGDDTEHPEIVDRAIDGDTSTSWTTERYDASDFGGLKSGVGLQLDLAEASDVSFVELDTEESGWSAQVYVADAPADGIAGWGTARASIEDAETSERVELGTPPPAGSVVLVWFTSVPSSGRITVDEVRVG